MKFITNGPDIPERLLHAHEKGRVVFFCGAGVSQPAGLPDFRNLVGKGLYKELSETPTAIEKAAIKAGRYDTVIDLLEQPHRIAGSREVVRPALARLLTPKKLTPKSTAAHEALLTLGQCRDGRLRLVTTNCDRLFEEVITRKSLRTEIYRAPLLPVPKKNSWNGLVYLHGLLTATPSINDLNRLVLSSGDFGLAYLVERWAARFVSELFRNYTVCFVGYSINDPVLRYMMDALAADRLQGESPPEMFAFGGYSEGKETKRADEWRAKKVTTILYHESDNHNKLLMTLRVWAETYRDGVRGKEMIIAQHATTPPLTPSRLDFAVGRVLWALTDDLAAKHFAEINPVPPLDWLEALAEAQFGHDDLPRFGVFPCKDDRNLPFSLIRRPSPYNLTTQMSLVNMGANGGGWDGVMDYMARWLTRHLDDPKLVLWLTKQGWQLHEHFALLINRRIEEIDKLGHDDKQKEIACIRVAAPKAIPGPLMRTLWRLVLGGHLKSPVHDFHLFDWLHRVKHDGLSSTLRMELRNILAPRVVLREPFRDDVELEESTVPQRIRDIVEWEVVLATDHVHSTLCDLPNKPDWQTVLPELLPEFSMLLRDTLDFMRELGGADDRSDLSYIHQPSISEHSQNKTFREWTALITLTRDAWLALAKKSPEQAQWAAEGWRQTPYPLFKRLTFFAATHRDVVPPSRALEWLLADQHWWLWSVETERETIRLLVALAPNLNGACMAKLEQAILQGPPREMFKDDIEPERWTRIEDREVWLRLAKTRNGGATLGEVAEARLDELNQQYPEWQLAPDERDEFPFWMGDGDEGRKFIVTPRKRRELMKWLTKYPDPTLWQDDNWRQRCRDDFPVTACALCGLARNDAWPSSRWREALQAWAEDMLLKRSWRYMAHVIANAPDESLQAFAHPLGIWLQAQAKIFSDGEEAFFSLIGRLLALEYEDGVQANDDAVSRAINHPIGHATEALLRWWYRQETKAAGGLQEWIKPLFTELCDTRVNKFRHGRVLLAAHVIALFSVDEQWTITHLLPLFDWQRSEEEARAAWKGFLWSPRFYRPLMAAIKQPLLETARHYEKLGNHATQYAGFLTFAALEPGNIFTRKELANATRLLPPDGLRITAQTMIRAIESAGEQRREYWRNRLVPYLKSIWPKSGEVTSPAISESLARLCVATKEDFPDALSILKYWMQPISHPYNLLRLLRKNELCKRFPADALEFLDIVIDNHCLLPKEFKECLSDISQDNPTLSNNSRFSRLNNLSCETIN